MTVIEIIAILAAGQLLMFGCYTLFSDDIILRSLSRFLLANSFYIINYLFILFYLQQNYWLRPMLQWGSAAGYLFGPYLYFYTRTVISGYTPSFKNEWVHYIPVAAYIAAFIVPYHICGSAANHFSPALFGVRLYTVFSVLMIAQILIYLLFALRELREHTREAVNRLSSYEAVHLSWLKLTLIAFAAMWLTDAVHSLFAAVSRAVGLSAEVLVVADTVFSFISLGINLVFANVIIIKGLKQPAVYSVDPERTEEPQSVQGSEADDTPVAVLQPETGVTELPGKKQWQAGLKPQEKKEVLEKLLRYMKEKKPYLRPTLTIAHIAAELKMPGRFISQVINEDLNKNFFDFINSYRIDEVIASFKDRNNDNLTISALMYDAGFNSKSVFNAAFKKHTGVTPSEYRRNEGAGAVA